MTGQHFDVVVLGRSFGALASALLLARRDFRVLVVGQGGRAPTYRLEGSPLARSAFTFLAATSPGWRRLLAEIAQTQSFRQRAFALDPMVDVLRPGARLSLPPDVALFAREVEREMPEVRRSVDDLYAELARVNAAADAAFDADAVWPPGTFWERRKTASLAAKLPWLRAPAAHDLLADFPPAHPYRDVVTALARFATHLADTGSPLPPFALARLNGSWARGPLALPGGEDELAQLLLDRIAAYGGTARLGDRATRLVLRHGQAAGVHLDGDEHPTGATFVVSDGTGEELAELTGGEGVTPFAERAWPRVTRASGRFVVSCRVRREGVPGQLGREAVVLPRTGARGVPLHLSRPQVADDDPTELLVAEMLVPVSPSGTAAGLADARERVLATLTAELPFLERHLSMVDSPHDGRPAWVWRDGVRRDVERVHLAGGTVGAEPMVAQWSLGQPGWMGIAGEPVRGPIAHTFLAGPTVLPALGQEGELIAAWSVAHIVTGRDRQRARMRRAMWSKFEIG